MISEIEISPTTMGRVGEGETCAGRLLRLGVGIWSVAFAVRLLFVWLHPVPQHFISQDSLGYYANAQALVEGWPLANRELPIGYSYVLAVFIAAGLDLQQIGHVVEPLLGSLVAPAVLLLLVRLGRPRAACWAASACALHPALVNASSQVLTEDCKILLMIAALYFYFSGRAQGLLATGLFLGLACVVRAPTLGLLGGLVVFDWFTRRSLSRVAWLSAGIMIAVTLVSLHFSRKAEHLIVITPQVQEIVLNYPVEIGGPRLVFQEGEQKTRGNYFQFMRQKPLAFLHERWNSLVTLIWPWPSKGERGLMRRMILAAGDGIVLAFGLWALVMWWRHRSDAMPVAWMVFPVMAAGLCLFYTAFYSMPRYRVPMLPLLICFGCLVLDQYLQLRRRPHFTNP